MDISVVEQGDKSAKGQCHFESYREKLGEQWRLIADNNEQINHGMTYADRDLLLAALENTRKEMKKAKIR